MKVLYASASDLNLLDYGIEIPLKGNRSAKIFEYAKTHYGIAELSSVPDMIASSDLTRVHNQEFIDGLQDDLYRDKYFHQCFELINHEGKFNRYNPQNAKENFSHAFLRILKQVNLTYLGLQEATKWGSSFVINGGMHHAMSDRGRGFCLLHDGLIALTKMIDEGEIKSAWIIDVDAHKGDGAPEILKNSKYKEKIKTMSLHMADAWPLNEEPRDRDGNLKPWFIPNDIDLEHRRGEEGNYLWKLKVGLEEMERRFPSPDVVWIVLGSDPYELDELPSTDTLKLSAEEMLIRDKVIYSFFKERNISQSYVLGGGYGEHSWKMYAQFLELVGHTEVLN